MPAFCIVNESTEDTLGPADNLQDAIRLAREAASQGSVGDPVSILDSGGLAVRQFVRMPDGTVAEQAIARQVEVPNGLAELNLTRQAATAERRRE